jgi:hypothetical protein
VVKEWRENTYTVGEGVHVERHPRGEGRWRRNVRWRTNESTLKMMVAVLWPWREPCFAERGAVRREVFCGVSETVLCKWLVPR